ncbi:hypothetical protein ACIBHY_33340 [Nonomuraea sp. NPDC050547]|uniref:hypothetical protein n=1 Tax=Nonomuraea sp. NPDC050547 TaxID=3364368 RepID=UPI00379A4FC7
MNQQRGGGALTAITITWVAGTPLLAIATFQTGFALPGVQPANGSLAIVLFWATLLLGFGAPALGFIVAASHSHKAGAWVYGVICALLAVIAFWLIPKERPQPVRQPEPLICTAPPDKAVGVPGC